MAQILRSKNRQKGDQFLYHMSDFCENCNPQSSYHTTAVDKAKKKRTLSQLPKGQNPKRYAFFFFFF